MNNSSVDNLIAQLDNMCRNEFDLNSVTCILKDLTNMMKSDNYKCVLMSNNWDAIVNLTQTPLKLLFQNSFENNELAFLAEYFRFLRNVCGGGISQNQQFILSSNEILNCVKKAISCFKDKTSEKEVIVLKCCIQLIGNLVCLSNDAKAMIWTHFLKEKIFICLFQHSDFTVREYTMMVLYNCLTDEVAQVLITTEDGHEILSLLLQSLCSDLVDWGILFLESILKHDNFFQNCYGILSLTSRLLILDIIIEQLSSSPGNVYFHFPNSSVNYIKDLFIEYVMNIVQICSTESSDMKPVEIVKLLSVLCDASVLDIYSDVLKSSRELLETLIDTLKTVHLLGKKSSNAFSCISSLKLINKADKEEIECIPSYGFKKNLIRLIGNLCYNCKENQDMVRKLDGIPLVLDCCNLDARNPFIMQWCILAIRNIMEKNPENQAVLASVSVTGDLVNSALIKEIGFEVLNENGRYVLKSLQT